MVVTLAVEQAFAATIATALLPPRREVRLPSQFLDSTIAWDRRSSLPRDREETIG